MQDILDRLDALEQANVVPPELDYEDPILYYLNPDGTPADPSSIEKIPDLINGIPNFEGSSDELSSWIKDVDTLVRAYQVNSSSSVAQKNKFYAICTVIRRKIKGEANTALVNSDVNINWNLIKKTLLTYYGEKRDLTTLDYQLMNITQGGRNLKTYYDEINKLLSLIAGQIKTNQSFRHPEASKALIGMYNKKAIDAFIRGLDGDIGKFLKNYEPESLANAYAYCITYQNIEFRKMMTKPKSQDMPSTSKNFMSSKLPPPIPPKIPFRMPNSINVPSYPFSNRQPMIPNMKQPLPHMQRYVTRPQFYQYPQQTMFPPRVMPQPFTKVQSPPQQISQPKPQPVYQPNPFQRGQAPMEVDSSLQTNLVNYANRPRNFHIESDDSEQYFQQLPYLTNNEFPEMPSFERYCENFEYQQPLEEQSVNDEPVSESELNFLG